MGTLREINERHEATIYEKDMTIAKLNTDVDEAIDVAKKARIIKAPWLDAGAKTLVGIGIGLVVGIIIAK